MFRIYITDSLYQMGRGYALNRRWIDTVRPREVADVDPNAVVADVVERAGLVVA